MSKASRTRGEGEGGGVVGAGDGKEGDGKEGGSLGVRDARGGWGEREGRGGAWRGRDRGGRKAGGIVEVGRGCWRPAVGERVGRVNEKMRVDWW